MFIKLKLSFFIFLLSFFIIGCSESPTDSKPKPPGYQEYIPWPSLADSPWPMYRADPQNTGRSKAYGPISGSIAWEIDSIFTTGGVAVGPDSSIFVMVHPSEFAPEGGLMSFDHQGNLNWVFPIPVYFSNPASPLVDKDGTIYTTLPGQTTGALYAIKNDGTLKWKREGFNLNATNINIDKEGNLYFINNNTELICINPQGIEKWRMLGLDTRGYHEFPMAFSPDAKTLYIPGYPGASVLSSIDVESQTVKWQFGDSLIGAQIMVDSNSNIYIIAGIENVKTVLYCLDPNGTINWSFTIEKGSGTSPWAAVAMSIDEQGNIFTGVYTLYSIDYKGNMKWSYKLDSPYFITSPILVDKNNTIFFDQRHFWDWDITINSFSNSGLHLWTFNLPVRDRIYYSSAIGYDNKIIIPGYRTNFLIALKCKV